MFPYGTFTIATSTSEMQENQDDAKICVTGLCYKDCAHVQGGDD